MRKLRFSNHLQAEYSSYVNRFAGDTHVWGDRAAKRAYGIVRIWGNAIPR